MLILACEERLAIPNLMPFAAAVVTVSLPATFRIATDVIHPIAIGK